MIKSRKALTISMVCALALSSLTFVEPTNAEAAGFDKTAQETVTDMGFGWNLGNSLDSYSGTTFGSNRGSTSSETAWGNPATTKAMIDMVKQSGVKTIRVPVTWYEHMDPNTYQIDQVWMNRVEEIVNWVLEDDMYCIINVHHDTGEKGWLKANSNNLQNKKQIFTSIWEQVSDNFKDYGDKLLFEGFNEILDGTENQWWIPGSEACPISNDLNQIFVDTVRKSGGNNSKRTLVCNTYCAGANNEITSQFVLPRDTVSNKIIVQTHVYQPFEFTHEDYPNVTTWTSGPLDNVLNNINRTFVKKGIPVIVGEFGCANKGNMDQITSWSRYLVEKCTNYGIGCIWWDNGNQYKIYNRRTLKVSQPELLNAMLEAAGTGTTIVDPPAPAEVRGDVNGDGKLDKTDVELTQKYIVELISDISYKADFNMDGEINVTDLIEMEREIANPTQQVSDPNNLCANEDNWASWTETSNGASGEMTYVDNGVSMQVNAGGKNDWDAQFFYDAITLEQGATYKVSFDYVSEKPQSAFFMINQGHGDYLHFYSDTLDWSTNVQHYTATFTYTGATDPACRVTFNLGGTGAVVPNKSTVTNLSLVKVSGGSNTDPQTPQTPDNPQTGVNLTPDASKFYGWWSEESGASANFTNLSNGFQIHVNNSGTENWQVQGAYPGIEFVEGATYEISFDYQADRNLDLGCKIQQNYDPYGQYHYIPLTFTNQKQHHSSKFTMTEETDDDTAFVFTLGAAGSNYNVTVTDLVIKRIS